jgi:hypothetical protein
MTGRSKTSNTFKSEERQWLQHDSNDIETRIPGTLKPKVMTQTGAIKTL